jgi:hypothetical protein
MKDSLVQQCLDILKRDDIKNEFKMLLKPVIDFILYEINPYIYITVSLVFLIFIMILAILIILIMLLRNRQILSKIFENNKLVS